MSQLPSNHVRRRLIITGILLIVVGFGLVIHQLYTIQIKDSDFYQKKALSQQLRTTSITANRGAIYDRNGNPLAVSETVWTVLFSPADITDEQAEILARGMSEILDVDPNVIIEKAKNKKNYYQIIKKRVDKEVADEVLKFAADNDINGVSLEEDSRRCYPYGSLASSVLGFVNTENKGAYGLEAYFNSTLSGTPGRVVSAKNAWGLDMPFRYQDVYKPQNGNSIVTTIDATVQQVMERHLRTAVIEHGVKNRAAGIFMNVKTGEILGMVTMPDFDPNNPNDVADKATREKIEEYKDDAETYNKMLLEAQFAQWNNKCISEPYEPGSVFKTVTLSAGLETGAVNMNSTFYCPGYHMVGNVRKHCWKTAGHGSQDLPAAVRNSCNPAFMMIGSAIGAHNFYQFFEGFGLTQPTGIPLPGEANGVYHSEKTLANPKDYENSLTSCAFGQTFKVTPIQMINAVAAACNGGYVYEPMLVRQVIDSQGNIVSTQEPKPKRQIISEETSKLVCQILESVVTEGSGKNAYIPGYRIGGKTGTSEKIDLADKTGAKEYILSFVGVAPMDDPQYACLVLLDEPSLTNAYGSTIAAPIVGAVFQDTLPYLGVEKVYSEKEKEKADITMPNNIGKDAHDAKSSLAKLNLNGRIVGDGGKVIAQVPQPGTQVPLGSTVLLHTESVTATETVAVPDVRGKTGMVANKLIINAGLNIRVTGFTDELSQYVVAAKQDIAPGTQVPKGTVITVDFANTAINELD